MYYNSNSTSKNNYSWSFDSTTGYSVRRIIVENPECWDEGVLLLFTDLVNNKTDTGWTIIMVIKGEIVYLEPDVETRTMERFIPLLKKRATRRDARAIDVFLNDHPFETPVRVP